MKYKFLNSAEVQEIIAAYPNTKAEVLAEKHGVPVSKIYATANRRGVKKSAEFLASSNSGRMQKGNCVSPKTQFKKGMISPRKGKKMIFNTEEAKKKSSANRWKKGQKPPNTAVIGEIRWREATEYFMIKIEDNVWEFYHKHIWEKENGPVPPGFNVVFKDGIKKNCIPENLECISNQELMARNTIARFPPELIGSIHRVSRLKRIIKDVQNG